MAVADANTAGLASKVAGKNNPVIVQAILLFLSDWVDEYDDKFKDTNTTMNNIFFIIILSLMS